MTTDILLLSGGIDSAVCAELLKSNERDLTGVFADYGQRAARHELPAAKKIATHFDINLEILSCRLGKKFHDGEITGRNLFLISSAMLFLGKQRGNIILGIHSGVPYYDCSEEFMQRMNILLDSMTNHNVTLIAPLLTWTKSEIINYGLSTDVPLSATYSCELGSKPPCGSCQSCKDREGL